VVDEILDRSTTLQNPERIFCRFALINRYDNGYRILARSGYCLSPL
jgi:hypothetical protein